MAEFPESSFLYVNRWNSGGNRLYNPELSDNADVLEGNGFARIEKQRVEVSCVDSLFPDESFDFIQIDAQEHDHDIIRGSVKTISKSMPTILLEFVLNWLLSRGINPEDSLKFYRNLGYDYFILEFDLGKNAEYMKSLKK